MDASKRVAGLLRRAARRLDPPPATPPATKAPPAAKSGPTPAQIARDLAVPAAPGSRRIRAPFFDAYPRFSQTSRTANVSDRLNARYEAIFGENADLFDGTTVLDIASHDGRWSLAALATGARFVTGIEGRPELVRNAEETLAGYGYGSDRVAFHSGDMFEVFTSEDIKADVVLCLGFMYHTMRYQELWDGMVRADPDHIVIDTQSRAMLGGAPIIYLGTDEVEGQMNAVADRFTRGGSVLTGRPNLNAIGVMARAYGYEIERLSNWPAIIRDNPGLVSVGGYAKFQRITVRLKRTSH